ncbi:MAG TPA: type II secretion system protein [Verrucomicrobiae bacterium]|nr:type II secretion system protein [Verrucomicrobiae bacterium]
MKLGISNRESVALTLVEVLVVVVVLGFLFALLFPWPESSNGKRNWRISCVNNLKQTGIAFAVWRNDHDGKFPMDVAGTNGGAREAALDGNAAAIFRSMSNELSVPKVLVCPADGSRFIATNFSAGFGAKNISYFIGLDAARNLPATILSGDDNLEVNGVAVKAGIINLTADAFVNWTTNRHRSGNIVFTDGSVRSLKKFWFYGLLAPKRFSNQ